MLGSISVTELQSLLHKVTLFDIRSVAKFQEGHIPGAVQVDKNELMVRPERFMKLGTPYYVYCDYGSKSLNICRMLSAKGYHVITVIGGYRAWNSK